ncbi:phosphatidylglycerophosphatase A [Bacillus ectoiniformans]|uniref:phosphatidylglycerophosphatase A family protein n=1 Tax=Bacillus ectoiniformans TaxID=1494429 RepID=UPI00195D39FF|nr:phosphatidylglycerophosphatase A [Bacillus ectoiniformans]MBM7647511.1 phosphatidylglycerophosphatase A [Bacillus ectoiniformans]
MKNRVRSQDVTTAAKSRLEERGVTIEDIAEIVFDMQRPYNLELTMLECIDSVEKVLLKREMQHAILVGVELDVLAEQKKLSEPLQSIIETDESLFGVDETIALGAALGYGSIAVTTYGYLDKKKVGIIEKLDTKNGHQVHTFLDDIIGAIAANAASRLAHRIRDFEDEVSIETVLDKQEEELIG